MRALWVGIIVVFSVLAGLGATGTVYSLIVGDDDLLGNAILLIGATAFAVLGRHGLRVFDRGAPAAARDFGRWLPAADPADGAHPELDARLRRSARRATGFAVGWAVVFAAGFTQLSLVDAAAEDLLHTGFHEIGEVVDVRHTRGTTYIEVSHGTRTDVLIRDSDRDYRVGDEVIVIYDPADPSRVRTADEPNEGDGRLALGIVPMLAALFGLPFSIGPAAGWRRRIRAVERTGWRRAGVTDDQLGGSQGRYLDAEFRDGTDVTLRRSWAFLNLSPSAGWKNRPVWVGGWGKTMVVGDEKGPYVLAAHAIRERVSRSRP
ncbi:hypothetical protein SAMN05421837_10789 [Amycolatopsis pretoriensis]|uniref:DUF3592 domain-containing protein n=1 Tax=Amycolatopsis pretoriensis TaxID=218821 RepID=A0A1H5R657_9PSEU|nr:DUF3592 domain-containing protein [Amycolatopsis pretoriensis]SEF33886.1 hypothetical protein SAMN05421837_10789 [Amycolatopsis pretoriensis]